MSRFLMYRPADLPSVWVVVFLDSNLCTQGDSPVHALAMAAEAWELGGPEQQAPPDPFTDAIYAAALGNPAMEVADFPRDARALAGQVGSTLVHPLHTSRAAKQHLQQALSTWDLVVTGLEPHLQDMGLSTSWEESEALTHQICSIWRQAKEKKYKDLRSEVTDEDIAEGRALLRYMRAKAVGLDQALGGYATVQSRLRELAALAGTDRKGDWARRFMILAGTFAEPAELPVPDPPDWVKKLAAKAQA